MKTPPRTPELCGSTSPSIAWMATAASAALPPWRRTSAPASAASGLAAATIAVVLVAAGARASSCAGSGAPAKSAIAAIPTHPMSNFGIVTPQDPAPSKKLCGRESLRHLDRLAGRVGHFHRGHPRGGRPDPQPLDKLLHGARIAAREHLDATIGEIASITGHAEFIRALRSAAAIEDSLHAAGNQTSLADHGISVSRAVAQNRIVHGRYTSRLLLKERLHSRACAPCRARHRRRTGGYRQAAHRAARERGERGCAETGARKRRAVRPSR